MKFILSEESKADIISEFKKCSESEQKKFKLKIYFQSIGKITHITNILEQLNFGLHTDICSIISEYIVYNTVIIFFDGINTIHLRQSKNEFNECINSKY